MLSKRLKGGILKTPLGERSERSERSDQDGRGELPIESCSKDTVRVRGGHLRKDIQHVSPRGFSVNALHVLLLTQGFFVVRFNDFSMILNDRC